MVNRLFQYCLSQLAPGVCLLCRQPSHRHLDLCHACEHELPVIDHPCSRCALPLPVNSAARTCGKCLAQSPAFTRCFAAWRYDFPIDHLITDFKHRNRQAAGQVLATRWLALQDPLASDKTPDLIMPVPLHWRRRWQRGFNQSQVLAERWSKTLNIPIGHQLQRIRATPPQQGLSARDRQKNLRQAFTVNRPHTLQGKHVALVDDVMTTGATANTLATILARYGVRRTDIWCLARTP